MVLITGAALLAAFIASLYVAKDVANKIVETATVAISMILKFMLADKFPTLCTITFLLFLGLDLMIEFPSSIFEAFTSLKRHVPITSQLKINVSYDLVYTDETNPLWWGIIKVLRYCLVVLYPMRAIGFVVIALQLLRLKRTVKIRS